MEFYRALVVFYQPTEEVRSFLENETKIILDFDWFILRTRTKLNHVILDFLVPAFSVFIWKLVVTSL